MFFIVVRVILEISVGANRCADEVECKWNYWVDTLGDPKCNNVTGPKEDNVCNYCCDNSATPCNLDPIPKQLSTFVSNQQGTRTLKQISICKYTFECSLYMKNSRNMRHSPWSNHCTNLFTFQVPLIGMVCFIMNEILFPNLAVWIMDSVNNDSINTQGLIFTV